MTSSISKLLTSCQISSCPQHHWNPLLKGSGSPLEGFGPQKEQFLGPRCWTPSLEFFLHGFRSPQHKTCFVASDGGTMRNPFVTRHPMRVKRKLFFTSGESAPETELDGDRKLCLWLWFCGFKRPDFWLAGLVVLPPTWHKSEDP